MIKHASFVVGNSSVGIREAPFYGVPSINIGTRQNRRDSFSNINTIYHAEPDTAAILKAINLAQIEKKKQRKKSVTHFGRGNSSQLFLKVVSDPSFWQKNPQKQFYDIV
jgi:UDP-N-acetylglucosamine 2-epimerase (hydrolysing)